MQRVLMIDDDQQVSAVLAMALEALGHEVIISNTTENTEELCLENKPDLILLDMMMPGRSGIELLEPIRRLCPDSFICMMTGLVDGDLMNKSLDEGAWNILYKPYSLADLIEMLETSALLSHASRMEHALIAESDDAHEVSMSWNGDQKFDSKDIASIVKFAIASGADGDLANRRIPVVTAELLNNAKLHGIASKPDQSYGIRCSKNDDSLLLEVHDSGRAFDWNRAFTDINSKLSNGSVPGLQLARSLSDRLEFSESEKTVRATFKL
jgi:CheY-like chemotaxis protein/anti-sigma regulatory factor (Ser/Thr protein kinase)